MLGSGDQDMRPRLLEYCFKPTQVEGGFCDPYLTPIELKDRCLPCAQGAEPKAIQNAALMYCVNENTSSYSPKWAPTQQITVIGVETSSPTEVFLDILTLYWEKLFPQPWIGEVASILIDLKSLPDLTRRQYGP